ncbi:MAG: hypothetical protein J6M30_05150 [Bacteroidales bacterium]|nr:hypothetical protein [Bacteroidales bacterium]
MNDNSTKTISIEEPTDEMLNELMHEVGTEVREKTAITLKEHYAKLRQSVATALNNLNSASL